MPFEITVNINSRDVVQITGHNCGPPTGDRELPTRIYRYTAIHPETGITTGGEVLHIRSEGIERLAAIILDDLAKHRFNSSNIGSNTEQYEIRNDNNANCKKFPYPRLRDLPEDERQQFSIWLTGQTYPMLDGLPMDEQDAYYPWDYERWRRLCR